MLIEPDKAKWIGEVMSLFPFVMWDRFLITDIEDGGKMVDKGLLAYGWIDRDDAYKDFVVLEFLLKEQKVYFIITSSSKYSKEISRILGQPHNDCERVENNFKTFNSVKLAKQA